VLILETFFDVEDGEAENLAPQVAAGQGQYAFGAPAPGSVSFSAQPAGNINLGQQQ